MAGETQPGWKELQLDILRERVRLDDNEAATIALVRSLQASQASDTSTLTDAWTILKRARTTHPRSVPLIELEALTAARLGLNQDLDAALKRLSRLDPDSKVLELSSSRTDDGDAIRWVESSWEAIRNSGSHDPEVSTSALAELEGRAAFFPYSSTHKINFALGLISAGRTALAAQVAEAAALLDDGSFADAYNLGVIFESADRPELARKHYGDALARAVTDDELDLVRGRGHPS